MKIKRYLQDIIEEWLFRGKVITIYGARQVGKTTLAKDLLEKHGDTSAYFDCDLLNVRAALESCAPETIKRFVGDHSLVVFDEAQQVINIGKVLKVFHDTYPEVQVIAIGSSSFELANRTKEFLTGRGLELVNAEGMVKIDARKDFFMLYGLYPEVCQASLNDARFLLENLTGKYLYKDILQFENIKKPDKLLMLLKLLACQLGNEVSVHELATRLSVNRDTVDRYLDLLEKSFVIFRMKAFSRNLRKELNKKEKIYFYDVGVRNCLISRFDDIALRDDMGGLWENVCILERKKYLQRNKLVCNTYFWRTYDGKEIDYIEEQNGLLYGYEFKFRRSKVKIPKEFLSAYPGSTIDVVNSDSFWEFISTKA